VLEVLTQMCVVSTVQWLIFLRRLGNLISISSDVGSSTLASHLWAVYLLVGSDCS
jgi:hypothetical protein